VYKAVMYVHGGSCFLGVVVTVVRYHCSRLQSLDSDVLCLS